MQGKKCTTKEAVASLEAGGVLKCIPHEVDPAGRMTTAVVALRKSAWWSEIPSNTGICGELVKRSQWGRNWIRFALNQYSGEINNATEL